MGERQALFRQQALPIIQDASTSSQHSPFYFGPNRLSFATCAYACLHDRSRLKSSKLPTHAPRSQFSNSCSSIHAPRSPVCTPADARTSASPGTLKGGPFTSEQAARAVSQHLAMRFASLTALRPRCALPAVCGSALCPWHCGLGVFSLPCGSALRLTALQPRSVLAAVWQPQCAWHHFLTP